MTGATPGGDEAGASSLVVDPGSGWQRVVASVPSPGKGEGT
jgi:hypothetical protein